MELGGSTIHIIGILALSAIAGGIALTAAIYSQPKPKLSFWHGAFVYIVGWIVGSAILLAAHHAASLGGLELNDGAKVLLSLAVLYGVMRQLLIFGARLAERGSNRQRHA